MMGYERVYAQIDLDALRFNMESMHDNTKKGTLFFAVIKTDAYGHGAVPVALELESLDFLYGFCVATVEEGVELRLAGIKKPILILGYVFPPQYETVICKELRPTVFTYEMAKELSQTAEALKREVPIHIAVDTGMGRIGYFPNEKSAKEIAQIGKLPHIIMEGIFTHFARADEADKTDALQQLREFEHMIGLCEQEGTRFTYRHCSNSAAILELPQANMDLVRAGIALYGLEPSDEVDTEAVLLKPVLSLKSSVSFVKKLPAGKSVSYGGTYTADTDRMVATIPVGYGDGYPRPLSNKGSVLIRGRRAPIIGRVCMDQFMVDVTEIPGVTVGDAVTLIGCDGKECLSVEELSSLSGRFHYELVCDLSSRRIPRVYCKNGEEVRVREHLLQFTDK
ncbi:MAG: alanine racemase [Lachnospiraceae bacterium]|nr:alanine racemase [Lachnospiraceae bacterium]